MKYKMASKLKKYYEIKLYLQFLQIVILITAVYSGNIVVVDRPIQKDVEEYIQKTNTTDESYMNVKKYLDEVENIKAEFNKKKEMDMSSVLKLLESVDSSLITDASFGGGSEGEFLPEETGARNFFGFNKKNIIRSLSSSNEMKRKPLTEILIKFKGKNKAVYDRFRKHEKNMKTEYANLNVPFVDTSSEISTTEETIQDSFEHEATTIAEILNKLKRASEEVNDEAQHDTPAVMDQEPFFDTSTGIITTKENIRDSFVPDIKTIVDIMEKLKLTGKEVHSASQHDSPSIMANLKEPFWDFPNVEIVPSILNPSRHISAAIEVLESTGEQVLKSITDISMQFPLTVKSMLKHFPVSDQIFDVINDYFKEEILDDSMGTMMHFEERVHGFIQLFDKQHAIHEGIDQLYQANETIEIAYSIKRQIIDNANFWKVAMSQSVRKLLSVFPECLRTLITSKKVCLLNRKYGLYLYAPGPIFYHDDERRVFGWDGPAHPGRADFIVEHISGDQFHLKNRFYNEYMYASDDWLDRNKRLVLQWLGGNAVNGAVWKLQLGNDYCRLLNNETNEYLCLDEDKKDPDRRIAMTCLNNDDEKTEFRFINCDYQ